MDAAERGRGAEGLCIEDDVNGQKDEERKGKTTQQLLLRETAPVSKAGIPRKEGTALDFGTHRTKQR